LTVIVNDSLGPGQLTPPAVNVGVTIIVATTGKFELFIAVKEPILPVPLAASPIEVLLFVHVYEVPVPEKLIDPVPELWQTSLSAGLFTVGIMFTLTDVFTVPVHPLSSVTVSDIEYVPEGAPLKTVFAVLSELRYPAPAPDHE
jgi:hypothetical protein